MRTQKLEVFNEFTTLAMIYMMLTFSAANAQAEGSNPEIEIIFIASIGFNLMIHLGLMLRDSILGWKAKIKRKCCMKKA